MSHLLSFITDCPTSLYTLRAFLYPAGARTAFTKLDCVLDAGAQCGASSVSFVSRMPKHVDNIDLTPGADVKPVLLIYVQEEASLSLIGAAICLVLIVRDRSADLVKAVQKFRTTPLLWAVCASQS